MNQNQNNEPSKADALKIATAYAFAGGLWILCSCFLSSYLIYDEYATFLLECGKGLLYVLVTAILLGWLLNHYCYKIRCTTELLSKSETRFKSFFEHPIAAVGLVRMRDGVFVDVNNAFARLHGYTREQIIGCTSEELQLWPSAERHQLIAELLENKTQVLPMQSLRKDSTVLSFLGAVQLTEMDGESCLLFTLIDQTGCKKAEDMLHQTEDRLQFIHETCRTGAWDLDLTNYTLFSSPEYNLIFGVINRIKPSQEKAVKCHHFLMNINPFLIFDQNFSNGNFYR